MKARGTTRQEVAGSYDPRTQAGQFRQKDSVGGTPTDAVETTALPKRHAIVSEGPRLLSCRLSGLVKDFRG
jgi:hypothetical protein